MKIEIRERGTKVPSTLRTHAQRCVELALARFDPRIAKVVVRFANANGEVGKLHKQCVIEVVIRPVRSVRVEHSDHDAFIAVDRAAERAARSLARALERERAGA